MEEPYVWQEKKSWYLATVWKIYFEGKYVCTCSTRSEAKFITGLCNDAFFKGIAYILEISGDSLKFDYATMGRPGK